MPVCELPSLGLANVFNGWLLHAACPVTMWHAILCSSAKTEGPASITAALSCRTLGMSLCGVNC
jgi:hypothetical protein